MNPQRLSGGSHRIRRLASINSFSDVGDCSNFGQCAYLAMVHVYWFCNFRPRFSCCCNMIQLFSTIACSVQCRVIVVLNITKGAIIIRGSFDCKQIGYI